MLNLHDVRINVTAHFGLQLHFCTACNYQLPITNFLLLLLFSFTDSIFFFFIQFSFISINSPGNESQKAATEPWCYNYCMTWYNSDMTWRHWFDSDGSNERGDGNGWLRTLEYGHHRLSCTCSRAARLVLRASFSLSMPSTCSWLTALWHATCSSTEHPTQPRGERERGRKKDRKRER